jgi:hypothetical protein
MVLLRVKVFQITDSPIRIKYTWIPHTQRKYQSPPPHPVVFHIFFGHEGTLISPTDFFLRLSGIDLLCK